MGFEYASIKLLFPYSKCHLSLCMHAHEHSHIYEQKLPVIIAKETSCFWAQFPDYGCYRGCCCCSFWNSSVRELGSWPECCRDNLRSGTEMWLGKVKLILIFFSHLMYFVVDIFSLMLSRRWDKIWVMVNPDRSFANTAVQKHGLIR